MDNQKFFAFSGRWRASLRTIGLHLCLRSQVLKGRFLQRSSKRAFHAIKNSVMLEVRLKYGLCFESNCSHSFDACQQKDGLPTDLQKWLPLGRYA